MNGMSWCLKVRCGNWISSVLFIVLVLMFVLLERKNIGMGMLGDVVVVLGWFMGVRVECLLWCVFLG